MKSKAIVHTAMCAGFLCYSVRFSYAQESVVQVADTSIGKHSIYDPFGPENSPDHNGQGSGGVITPSPYETVTQAYYTGISSDYLGIQYMLDSPWQFSAGTGWTSYQTDIFGILFKIRTSGFQASQYDPVVEDSIPFYRLSLEASLEYALNDRNLRSFKIRLHEETKAKSLEMAGAGVLVSDWNVMVARDLPMDRKWEATHRHRLSFSARREPTIEQFFLSSILRNSEKSSLTFFVCLSKLMGILIPCSYPASFLCQNRRRLHRID